LASSQIDARVYLTDARAQQPFPNCRDLTLRYLMQAAFCVIIIITGRRRS